MHTEEDLELRFLRAYKDYIYVFNLIEHNVILCLAHAKGSSEFSIRVERYARYSFNTNVKRLKALIDRNALGEDFCKWLASLEACRLQRNKIVHGEWLWRLGQPAPIIFDSCREPREHSQLTISEFLEGLESMKEVLSEFGRLRRKYEIKEPAES